MTRRGLAATSICPSQSGETMSPMVSWSGVEVPRFLARRAAPDLPRRSARPLPVAYQPEVDVKLLVLLG
jgi:hypothetical protein